MKDSPRLVRMLKSLRTYRGNIWSVERDDFVLGEQTLTRDYIQHMGAVAIVAIDEAGRIAVVKQYRHAVACELVEIPAGLLDYPDEDPLAAAQRELLEETGCIAEKWEVLVDMCTTPGSSSEAIRIYRASGITQSHWSNTNLHGEEREMSIGWVAADEARRSVLQGEWNSPTAIAGILAHFASPTSAREAKSPWWMREHLVAHNRVFHQDK